MTATGEVLDLERMRADVARVLECKPAEIGDDDNLIDLDLDSMRMLGLVLAWATPACRWSSHSWPSTPRCASGGAWCRRCRPHRAHERRRAGHAGGIDRGAGGIVVRTAAGTGQPVVQHGTCGVDRWAIDVAAFVAAADQAAVEAEAFALRFAEGDDGQPCSGTTRHMCHGFR